MLFVLCTIVAAIADQFVIVRLWPQRHLGAPCVQAGPKKRTEWEADGRSLCCLCLEFASAETDNPIVSPFHCSHIFHAECICTLFRVAVENYDLHSDRSMMCPSCKAPPYIVCKDRAVLQDTFQRKQIPSHGKPPPLALLVLNKARACLLSMPRVDFFNMWDMHINVKALAGQLFDHMFDFPADQFPVCTAADLTAAILQTRLDRELMDAMRYRMGLRSSVSIRLRRLYSNGYTHPSVTMWLASRRAAAAARGVHRVAARVGWRLRLRRARYRIALHSRFHAETRTYTDAMAVVAQHL